jgi:KDO2-lipid IV(A) lauroyltransferase
MTGKRLRFLALSRKSVQWIQAQLVFALMGTLRLLPPEWALNVLGRAARKVGPYLGRNSVTLHNLALALPERSKTEHDLIAGDMWENMARLTGEYIFLDDLFDFDPANPGSGHIDVVGAELFTQLCRDNRPKIFITAHMGNFELLPIAAASFGLNVTAMFRPPNNPFIAERILGARKTRMGHLVPSKAGAALSLARVLETGGNVGVLVDQNFSRGLKTTFFGVPCLTSPLVAKLARQYDCDIYPAFCIRLPGARFRLTLEDKLPIARDAKGAVDQLALTQSINDRVENWVGSHPGQWMWFHKRWKGAK